MFTRSIIALFALALLQYSCHKNCDDDLPVIGYVDYEVDFFNSHPDFFYLAPTYEAVTEQVLTKAAHQEGAIFEQLTEIILVKDASSRIQIQDSTAFSVVQNVETLQAAEVVCYDFWPEEDFIFADIPAEYKTITRLVVLQQGTGAEVPAEYSTVNKRILDTPAQLIAAEGQRTFTRMNFRLPDTLMIESYLLSQLAGGLASCEAGRSYRIN